MINGVHSFFVSWYFIQIHWDDSSSHILGYSTSKLRVEITFG